jgi:hypothetical protein
VRFLQGRVHQRPIKKGETGYCKMKRKLVLSAGMPRAGSGWHYNLIHDLVVASGGQDARQIRRRYHLERFLTEVNCNLSTLSAVRLMAVILPVLFGNTFAIKTHAGPTPMAKLFMGSKSLLSTYIYRDPRAVMLSAYEYGRRAIDDGRANAFSHLDSLDAAISFMKPYLNIWEKWMACESVLKVRYEDLLTNYDRELIRLLECLQLEPGSGELREILEKYRPERGIPSQRGTHYNVGKPERFRDVFTPEQLSAFNQAFGSQLIRMGYHI